MQIIRIPEEELEFYPYSDSEENSEIILRWHLGSSKAKISRDGERPVMLTPEQKRLIRSKVPHKINEEDYLILHSGEKDQPEKNKKLAVARLYEILGIILKPKKKRK